MHMLLQPAYLLHTKPYRETSFLADFITQEVGRIRVVIKGARQIRSRYRGIRPFTPLLISCQGKSDLLTLTDLEMSEMPYLLEKQALFCAFYLNELLLRLLLLQDPYPNLFLAYQDALIKLSQKDVLLGPVLRNFEFLMLSALGYGFRLDQTVDQQPIIEEQYYIFHPKRGLVYFPGVLLHGFKGSCLLNFHQNQWADRQTQLSAKRLMQLAMAPLLGETPLKTKIFFENLRDRPVMTSPLNV